MLLGLIPIAAAVPQPTSELVSKGSARSRVATAPADLVLFYGGEQHGNMDTCGCKNKRGSLARVDGFVRLSRTREGSPDLLVNTGNWLDDATGSDNALRPDVKVKNQWMVDGMQAGGWDALNVSFRDLPYLAEAGFPATSVSANLTSEDQPLPAKFLTFERGGRTIAVTGVSVLGKKWLQPEGYVWSDPVAALGELVPKMQEQADVVVVLAYETWDVTDDLAVRVPGIDVIVEAGHYEERYPAWVELHTVTTRSRWQTERLGELRLAFDDEGVVTAALDRKIDLDGQVPASRRLRQVQDRAGDAIDAAQQRVFGPVDSGDKTH